MKRLASFGNDEIFKTNNASARHLATNMESQFRNHLNAIIKAMHVAHSRKCTPANTIKKEASMSINACADSLKIPNILYRPSDPFVRVEREKTSNDKLCRYIFIRNVLQ